MNAKNLIETYTTSQYTMGVMQQMYAKVLIAEDDTLARDIIAEIVSSGGHTVDTVSDGHELLEKYFSEGSSHNLLISDMHMPGLGAMDVIKRLRGEGDDVPIIVLTGDQDIATALEAMKSGADDYVIKSEYVASTILISIEKTLEKYRYRSMSKELAIEVEGITFELAEKNQLLDELSKTLDYTLQKLTRVGASLMSEKDLNSLLEIIVLETIDVSNSDGGTLYTLKGEKLHFKIIRNNALHISMGGISAPPVDLPPVTLVETNVAALCAIRKEIINIPDIYETEFSAGFKEFDRERGYRTRSMLLIPLEDRQGNIVGVLQLVNCTDRKTGQAAPYSEYHVQIANSLASHAAICTENMEFTLSIQRKKSAFERFVPIEFLQFLERKDVEDITLGDACARDLSIMFADIRSFTSLSERMTPEENFRFLNSYLKSIGPVIAENGGFIDKYIGDAIMALFSGSKVGLADDAIAAAVGMMQRLCNYNVYRKKSDYSPIVIGIGINTGRMTLGTVGFERRMETTVVGDTVNIASRVESLTKLYGISIATTADTLERLKESNSFLTREIDVVKVKGREKALTVFEVFDCDPDSIREAKLNNLDRYREALHLYKNDNWSEAGKVFREVSKDLNGDKVVGLYLERCAAMLDRRRISPEL